MATEAEPIPVSTPSAADMQTMKVYPAPLSLLEKLDHMLGSAGSIKSTKDVAEFVKVMQVSQFLVSRCIILNVIKSTKAPSTLAEFMESGGWAVLNLWLAEAKKTQNIALLVELLLVLEKLPVTISALKQGNMGKLVKQLSKIDNPEVKSLASDILAKWMAIFRGQPPPAGKGSSGDKSEVSTEGRGSSLSEDDSSRLSKLKKDKSEKKSSGKKKSSKTVLSPPVESAQMPPGPMVALGKPKDKLAKRQRDPALQKAGQPPPEKKAKGISDPKGGKGLMESEGFMAFLSNQAATKLKEKKVKKVPKIPKIGRTNSVTSDTTEPKQEVTTPTTDTPQIGEEMEEMPTEPGTKKKRVTWASESNLTIMHYFEMDEAERVNVNQAGNFLAAAQQEKRREREALESGLMFSRDRLAEAVAWQRPQIIEIPGTAHPRGQNSEEKERQTEREKTVLAQLFLNKSSVQPSPLEPDPEPSIPDQEPKLIPLNEPGVPADQSPSVYPPPPPLPLPPAHAPLEPPLMSPGTTINQAQSLINFYNENNKGGGGPGDPIPPRSNGQFPQPPPPGGFYPGGPRFMGMEPPGMRGGPPGEFRGMGRGGFRKRFPPTGLESKICKHFSTHGCRLGANCRFLHCTPEELAANGPPMRGFRGRGRPWGRGGPPFNPPPHFENSPDQMNTAPTPPTSTSEPTSSPVAPT